MKKRSEKAGADRGRRWIRRIARGVLWFALGVVLLIVCAIVVIRLYPEEKAGRLIAEGITRTTGMPAAFETVSVNPLGRIDVGGIDVGGDAGEFHLRMERLGVRFRLLPLLARRLEVASVALDSPVIRWTALPGIQEREAPPDSLFPPLPVSFGLFRLLLKDFAFRIVIPDSAGETVFSLNRVSLELGDLRVPRDVAGRPEEIRGRIRLTVDDGALLLGTPALDLQMRTDLHLEGARGRDGRWSLTAGLGVRPEDSGSSLLLHLGAQGSGLLEEMSLSRAKLLSDDQLLLDLTGTVLRSGEGWKYDFRFGGDYLDVGALRQGMLSFIPPERRSPLDGISIAGKWRAVSGRAWGDERRVRVRMVSELPYARFSDGTGNLQLFGGMLELDAAGGAGGGGVGLGLAVDSIAVGIRDSLLLTADRLFVELSSDLDRRFYPVQGSMDGGVGGLFGGNARFRSGWSSDGGAGGLRMDGALRLDSLELALLPGMTDGIGGRVFAEADVEGRGFDAIRAGITLRSENVSYALGGEQETAPDVRLFGEAFLRTEESFEVWTLDSARVHLDEVLSGLVYGSFHAGTAAFDVTLRDGRVQNSRILEYMPASLRSNLEGAAVFGEEVITGRMAGRSVSDSVSVSVEGEIRIVDAGVTSADPGMDVRRVNGRGTFSGRVPELSGRVEVSAGQWILHGVRETPFEDGGISFDWAMDADGGMRVQNGNIEAARLGIHGTYDVSMVFADSLPSLSGDAVLSFRSADTVEIAGGIVAAGGAEFRVHGETLPGGTEALRLEGELRLDSLSLEQDGMFRVTGMHGLVPFSLDGDLVNARFLKGASEEPVDLDTYARRRRAYLATYPGIGLVRTGPLNVAGYRAEGVWMDVFVGSGFVQIPAFNIDVFGGNLGGSVYFDVGGGMDLVRYDLRAQASRINSAALLPGGSRLDEQNELNATLAFRGRGIDVEEGIELEGAFHITEIGPRFASTLLESLDPSGSDRSIRMTRRLLNAGWKPHLFSFELRHGYVYPSISLAQPWFSPIRIPGKLEYARLPLDFFLTSMQP